MIYDIIGDIHGNAGLLEGLLHHFGYRMSNKTFFHPDRKAIYVGDFINRGKDSRKTLQIIRTMVDNGNAFAILGNHEIYAIIYNLKDKNGVALGRNDSDLAMTLKNTQKEFSLYPEEWKSYRRWLRTLPLFLDFGNFRVIHAYWNDTNVAFFRENFTGTKIDKEVFREIYKNPGSELGKMVWQTTKGIDFDFPPDIRIRDNKGVFHRSFRMNWWDSPVGRTFEQISFEDKFRLPEYTVPPEIIPNFTQYPVEAPIIFFGHYRRINGPFIIRPNVCCLDSGPGITKILTAYSFDGEKCLDRNNLFQYQ